MIENYVNKQGRSKLNNSHMSSLMYAIIICKAKLIATNGIGIYNLTKSQNSRHYYDFIISIDKNMISKFEAISGIELKEPIILNLSEFNGN